MVFSRLGWGFSQNAAERGLRSSRIGERIRLLRACVGAHLVPTLLRGNENSTLRVAQNAGKPHG